ncbi:IPT/TIG domain-containing protein [Flavobacterium sp. GSA192]|uniref:IPT/TIG domain-containing protein n=1 Tax=Flavobacterium sp. GSA192 TaxID=2576304 RepID=UPI001126AD9D|nr:IPT/TIG domain-containing protein [Flavobacterium sp. GSA192]
MLKLSYLKNTIFKKVFFFFLGLSFLMISCNNSDNDPDYVPPTLKNFPESGLLGQPISIQIENMEIGKIQVFFDLEEADVKYTADNEIMVIVPTSIKRYNPTLKIIDLNENKTILSSTFTLKKPVITKYSSDNISFNETLTIYGENFDTNRNLIKVLVNNEIAQIQNTDFNKVEIMIPTKLTTANLEIKVQSQLQEASSTLPLVLKNPIIKGTQLNQVWLQQTLDVNIENVNPNSEFGEVFVNGIPCYFSASTNNIIGITIPPGPYKDFFVTNITYKTAGLTTSYDCNIKILNNFILVDHIDNAQTEFNIFIHNNKAYTFSYTIPGTDEFERYYTFLEFSPVTEKWKQISTFHYTGHIVNAVYDGNNTVYFYKLEGNSQSYSLSKFNMDTNKETAIDLPNNKIVAPLLFAFHDKLYLYSGLDRTSTSTTVRNKKYEYSKLDNTWRELSSSVLSELPLTSEHAVTTPIDYVFIGEDIYISYGLNYSTFKISPNLSVTKTPYALSFQYGNNIIVKSSYDYLYNTKTNKYVAVDILNLTGYSNNFFTLNNEVYYLRNSWSMYYQNTIYTQKISKQILNGLL